MKKIKLFSLSSIAILFAVITFSSCETKTDSEVGLQIYSVRENIKQNIDSTFEQLAKIGYKNLELAGYKDGKFYDMSPEDFKALCDKYGFNIISSHCNITPENVEQTAKDAVKLGIKYIIKPYFPEDLRDTIANYFKLANDLEEMGKIAKQNGVKLGYHNHAFEFELTDSLIPYEVLLENTTPENVVFEMDLFWVTKAGQDPVELFEKYPGRFELWHVKDMDDSEEKKFAPVGSGTINFERIFDKKETAGMKYFFVEQDKFFKYTPLESVKMSFDYLNNSDFLTMLVAGKTINDMNPTK